MNTGGISIILVLGIINFLLILFQISTGKRWVRVPFMVHRTTGMVLLINSAIHGILAYFAG